eukprot:726045_1
MSSTQASSSSSMGVHEQVHVLIPRRNADISSPSAGIPCEIDRSTQFLSFMSSEPQLQSPNQNHTSSYLNVLQSQPSLSTLPMLHQPFPVLSGTIVSDIPPPPPPLPNLADLMPPNITNNPILLQSEIVPNAIATQSQSLPIYLPPINLGFPVLSPQIISTDSSSPLPQSPGPTLLGNVPGQNDDYPRDNLFDQSPNSVTVPMGRDRRLKFVINPPPIGSRKRRVAAGKTTGRDRKKPRRYGNIYEATPTTSSTFGDDSDSDWSMCGSGAVPSGAPAGPRFVAFDSDFDSEEDMKKRKRARKVQKTKKLSKAAKKRKKFAKLEDQWKKGPNVWKSGGLLQKLGTFFDDQYGSFDKFVPVSPAKSRSNRTTNPNVITLPQDVSLPELFPINLQTIKLELGDRCSTQISLENVPVNLRFSKAQRNSIQSANSQPASHQLKSEKSDICADISPVPSDVNFNGLKSAVSDVNVDCNIECLDKSVLNDAPLEKQSDTVITNGSYSANRVRPVNGEVSDQSDEDNSASNFGSFIEVCDSKESSHTVGFVPVLAPDLGSPLASLSVLASSNVVYLRCSFEKPKFDGESDRILSQILSIDVMLHRGFFTRTLLRSQLLCSAFSTILSLQADNKIILVSQSNQSASSENQMVSSKTKSVSFQSQSVSSKPQPVSFQSRSDSMKDLIRMNLKLDTAALYESVKPQWARKSVQPARMRFELRNYQKQAVSWMMSREAPQKSLPNPLFEKFSFSGRNDVSESNDNLNQQNDGFSRDRRSFWFNRHNGAVSLEIPNDVPDSGGGILAEEMGLGKTVESIALIELHGRKHWLDGSERKPNEKFRNLFSVAENDLASSEALLKVLGADPTATPIMFESVGTLIICPISIAYQWIAEVTKHASHLKLLLYDGKRKHSNPPSAEELASCDIVLATYPVLREEVNYNKLTPYTFRGGKRFAIPETPLLQIDWQRLLLDEAQHVETTVAAAAKMARRIRAKYRWCVTGTPIGQHGLQDLYGLMVFLGQEPWTQQRWWNKAISLPYFRGDSAPLLSLLDRVMWRHSKVDVADELNLPPLTEKVVRLDFSPVEEEYYKRLLSEQKEIVEEDASKGRIQENETVSRLEILRQACCHPQVSRRSFVGDSSNKLLSMKEIMKRMISQAEDELTAKERELCRWLNVLGKFHLESAAFVLDPNRNVEGAAESLMATRRSGIKGVQAVTFDQFQSLDEVDFRAAFTQAPVESQRMVRSLHERARKLFVEAWRIADAGIKHGQDESSEELKQIVEITTKNIQVREWRQIEMCTTHFLSKILQRQIDKYRPANEHSQEISTQTDSEKELRSELSKMRKQFRETREELLEIPNMKISNMTNLMLKYETEVIPDISVNTLPSALELLRVRRSVGVDEFNKRSSYSARVEKMEDEFKEERTRIQHCQQYIHQKSHIISLSEIQENMCQNEEVVQVKQKFLEEFKSRMFRVIPAEPPHDCSKCSERQSLSSVGPADYVPHALSPFETMLPRFLKVLSKGVSMLEREHAEDLTTLDANPEHWPALKHQLLLDWRKVTDSITLLRNFKEIKTLSKRLESAKSDREVSRLKLEMECLPIPLKPDSMNDKEYEFNRTVKEIRIETEAKYRRVNYLRHKSSLLISSEVFALGEEQEQSTSRSNGVQKVEQSSSAKVAECPICKRTVMNPVLTGCAHLFCEPCLFAWRRINQRCAVCRQPLRKQDIFQVSPALHGPSSLAISGIQDQARSSGSGIQTQPSSGIDAQSSSGIQTQTNSGIYAQSSSRIQTQSSSGIQTQTSSGISTQSSSEVRTQAASEVQFHSGFGMSDSGRVSQTNGTGMSGGSETRNVTTQSSQSSNIFSNSTVESSRKPEKNWNSVTIKGRGQFGTKIEALLKHIRWFSEVEPSAKSLVFSQWGTMLDFVSRALKLNGVEFAHLTGTARQRAKLVSEFQSSPSVKVLLLSLRFDASGLTLTQATHVFLLEPSVNPAVEDQAINRVYRIGQTRPTFVHRFVMSNSVEENIREMQSQKRKANRTVMKGLRSNPNHGQIDQNSQRDDSTILSGKQELVENAASSPIPTSLGMEKRQREEMKVSELLDMYTPGGM